MNTAGGHAQLSALEYRQPSPTPEFPFAVPAISTLDRLSFDAAVTVLVGDNGAGKSTFIEALAIATELPAVGSARPSTDPTLGPQRRLARHFRLTWRERSRRGFFLRAEDFFGFQKQIVAQRIEHEGEIERIDAELANSSDLARRLAKGPHYASIGALDSTYGRNPDGRSHGEAFLNLFAQRLSPRGLFLLDEPEAALSPQSQLGFVAMIREAVDKGSQFIIATHSPILMAIPGARILSFDENPVRRVDWDELESVALVRDFLQAPERYMRMIWDGAA